MVEHAEPLKFRSVREIIESAGGAPAIAKASEGTVTVDVVYKWQQNRRIPDNHWPLVMPLANATADEMLAANLARVSVQENAA